ncbi:MAG: BT_3987 domain-containing protein [Draconibacterium sp.]
MRGNNKYLSMLLGLLILIASCDDNKDEFLSDYDTIFYFLKSGEQDLTLYKTGENTDHSITINKAGSNLNATGVANVSVLDDAQMALYNQENETAYSVLPATAYEFLSATSIDFGVNDKYKIFQIQLKTDVIESLGNEANYVLPLSLTSQDSVNAKKQILILSPTVEIPVVYFTQTGYVSNSLTDNGDTQVSLSLPLTLSATNKWDFDCTVEIDETLIAAYNEENNVNFTLLPSNAYTLTGNGTVSFTSEDQTVKLDINVDRTKLTYGNYILPLRLTECSRESFAIDQANNTCLFGISYTPDAADLVPLALTAGMLSSNAVEPSEGSLANLLDGDVNTYFHSAWSVNVEGHHYLQVDLNSAISAFTFDFTGRATGGAGNPKTIDIYASADGATYEKVTTITQDQLPTGAKATYSSPVIVMPESTSIRFVVPQNMNGGSYFVFSEFSMKGL